MLGSAPGSLDVLWFRGLGFTELLRVCLGANNVLSERFERKFCAKVWSESFDRKLLFRSLVLGIGGRRAGRPLLWRAVSWAGDGWGGLGWAG